MSVIEKLDSVLAVAAEATPGEWMLATSCSWRRIVTVDHRPVITPITQRSDGHPDLDSGLDHVNAELAIASANLLRDHGPAMRQDMIDARRYRFIRLRLWPSDVDEILDEYPAGTNFYDSVEDAAKRIDAAIDVARVTGEGEGHD